jgi:hypothetical protein
MIPSNGTEKSQSKLRQLFNREPVSPDNLPAYEHDARQLEPSEAYVYQSLEHNEIRIFWMQLSSSVEDEIVGMLETVNMGERRKFPRDRAYHALSYAWGPTYDDRSHLTDTIICDDCQLRVTSNVKQALRRIRAHGSMQLLRRQQDRSGNPRDGMGPLWIDAICINQDDHKERNSQVRMMGRIFTECLSLVIWLGEPDEGVLGDEQCELLGKLCTVSNGVQWEQGIYPLPGYGKTGEHLLSVLKSILARPWFSRRWVIQECAPQGVSGCIMLGAAQCHRDLFTALLKRKNLLSLAKPLQMPRLSRTIFQTLYTFDNSQCEDARDRVFALKELSGDGNLIQVDYNQDVRNTYLNVARRIVFGVIDVDDFATQFFRSGPQISQRVSIPDAANIPDALTLLALASCKKPIIDDKLELHMESWLPDWRIPTEFESIQHEWAVEMCLRDDEESKDILLTVTKHELVNDRNGYNYYATEGIIVANHPRSRSTASRVGLYDSEQLDFDTKLQCWAESVQKRLESHCQDQGTNEDLVWLTLAAWPSKGRRDHRMLAFIIRPSQRRSTFQNMPVYRLVSCLMTEVMPVLSTVEIIELTEERTATLRTAWQTLTESTPFLSWQEFCLE